MGVRFLGNHGAWITTVVLALASASCSEADTSPSAARPEISGSLQVPLEAVGRSGATYSLDGSFSIENSSGVTVATLSTADDPDAQVLSIDLDVGAYTVELLDGWTLDRIVDGSAATVPASLASDRIASVTIAEDGVSVVVFRFVTGDGNVEFRQGTLGVSIDVDETPACGNGVVDPGEFCDGGANAGQPDGCDTTCAFRCEGACPLRVDPAAPEDGDGTSWASPRKYIQAAIDVQGALGGGEIWVKGPGPFEALTGNPTAPLIQLRDGVSLYGGFIGTEIRRTRGEPAFRTIIGGAQLGELDETAPLIVGASNTTLENFAVVGHEGTVLAFRGARNFRVSEFSIEGGVNRRVPQIEVTDSSGVFAFFDDRDARGLDAVTGIHAERSELRLLDAEFDHLRSVQSVAGVYAIDSRLVLERVRFTDNDCGGLGDAAGLRLEDSEAFALSSLWLRNRGEVSALVGSGSRFVAVNSHFEENVSTAPVAYLVAQSSGLFLNSSFVANDSGANGTLFLQNGELEVVNSSFLDNEVHWPTPGVYSEDIGADSEYQITLYNSYSNRGQSSILQRYTGDGNCLIDGTVPPHLRTDAGYTEVFLTEAMGCTDIGDDSAANAAAARAREFAASLGSTPHVPDGWWQGLTSVHPLCADDSPVDPGRHYAVQACML